ncbi:flagellar export chaperone FliS [Roseateles toxinivorans]|uniref:Flagellar secretion chaperone FliS n=1 Tax=Roseateles toxinivorans TaxID=270368 RepID=A0A4R6QMQ7_9BURK|nr:flagellar export chaperone FliS [Roseateles toxinivorans]TDP71623.1 flagellar protein FliS [Roseateles toxinivorans]
MSYMPPNGFASQRMSNMYRAVGTETSVQSAGPHRLVAMLFEGLMDSMAQAKGAMRAGNLEAKGKALGRAVRIIEEGLRAALDMRAGPLAADLQDLYSYTTLRLTQANLRNDEAAIEECQRLLQPLKDAWDAIGDQVEPRRAA